jgi:hypothetical protein
VLSFPDTGLCGLLLLYPIGPVPFYSRFADSFLLREKKRKEFVFAKKHGRPGRDQIGGGGGPPGSVVPPVVVDVVPPVVEVVPPVVEVVPPVVDVVPEVPVVLVVLEVELLEPLPPPQPARSNMPRAAETRRDPRMAVRGLRLEMQRGVIESSCCALGL